MKKDEEDYIPNNIINNNKKEYDKKIYDEKKDYEKKYNIIKNNHTDIKNNENGILQKSIELNSFNPGTSPNNNSFMDKLNIRILTY